MFIKVYFKIIYTGFNLLVVSVIHVDFYRHLFSKILSGKIANFSCLNEINSSYISDSIT